MWSGWSPCEPRRSGICLLLPRGSWLLHRRLRRHLPTCGEDKLLRRLRRHLPTGVEYPAPFGDQGVDRLGRQVVVVAVVEPHHRRELAGAEALDLFEAEEPVRRNLVRAPDSDRLLDVVDDLVRAAQRAAEVCADIEAVLAHGLEVKQGVEGRDTLDVSRVELERRRDLAHGRRRQVAELFLRQVERRHHRRPGLRVLRRQLFDLVEHVCRKRAFLRGFHRSTSPSTASAVPMMATMSATMWFIAIRSSGWRLTNDAERNLTRRGLCVPSLTT